MRKSIPVLILVICSLYAVAYADIPPEPGYKRVTQNLIIQPQEDFGDYRFFVKTGSDLSEIFLKKGEQNTIKQMSGGAFYPAKTLLACSQNA